MIPGRFFKSGGIAVLPFLWAFLCVGPAHGQNARPSSGEATIPASALIQPQELNRILHEQGAKRPVILQVGSRMMFDESHIPGAEYAGPASQPEGLDLLRQKVARLGHATPIVIYCGCCPWTHCPNIRPAYKTLHEMGYKHVRALYLADNFGTDWVSKGYPVEHSH